MKAVRFMRPVQVRSYRLMMTRSSSEFSASCSLSLSLSFHHCNNLVPYFFYLNTFILESHATRPYYNRYSSTLTIYKDIFLFFTYKLYLKVPRRDYNCRGSSIICTQLCSHYNSLALLCNHCVIIEDLTLLTPAT